MKKMIIVDAAEPAACPKCSHLFPLSDGISRQAIERAFAVREAAAKASKA